MGLRSIAESGRRWLIAARDRIEGDRSRHRVAEIGRTADRHLLAAALALRLVP